MYIVKQQYQCLLGGILIPSTSFKYEPIPENYKKKTEIILKIQFIYLPWKPVELEMMPELLFRLN